MATVIGETHRASRHDDRFFFIMAIIMTLIVAAGFSLQLAMGRSSFSAPMVVHAHALVFMGWVAIYLTQNALVAGGSITLHRRLGWLATGWVALMLVFGTAVTVAMVREGRVPFFFKPLHFLIFDPVSALTFALLVAMAIVRRRETDWHRRLHYCGMAILTGPAFGRLLPMPFLIPYAFQATFVATLILPAIGVIADLRRTGRVHPAWWLGIGAMFAMEGVIEGLTYSPLGMAIYQAVTAGSPGAAIAPLAFAQPPLS